MPEGDTVYRAAKNLDAVLHGQTLTASDFRVPAFATVDLTGLNSSPAEIEAFLTDTRTDAYERLIGDAMDGEQALFARQDLVEAAWAIVDPVLGTDLPVASYEQGSWGPREADALVDEVGGWRVPRRES